jgi:hypothetical protein
MPPAEVAAIILIGRVGYCCAAAVLQVSTAAITAAA